MFIPTAVFSYLSISFNLYYGRIGAPYKGLITPYRGTGPGGLGCAGGGPPKSQPLWCPVCVLVT